MLDRPIRRQPFVAETVEPFTLRRSFLAHLLAKRLTVDGASEAGARTGRKTGSVLLRRTGETGATAESNFFSLAMPPNVRERNPGFASRLELQLLQLQLHARCNCSHTIPRALTFDMRGAQKAQPFGHPLDGRVRAPSH